MYQTALVHLPYNTGINSRGICSILGVPIVGIATLPKIIDLMADKNITTGADMLNTAITLKSGYSWLKLVEHGNYNINLAHKSKRTPQGQLYTYTLRVLLPNDTFDNVGKIIRGYEKQQWVLRISMLSAAERLIGNAQRGAILEYDADTGSLTEGQNMHTLGFTFATGTPAFYLINP